VVECSLKFDDLPDDRHGMLRQLLLHSADGTDFDNVGNIGDELLHDDRPGLGLQLLISLVSLVTLNWLQLVAQ